MGIQETLSALSDPTRRSILASLRSGKIASGELAQKLSMSPSALSYHLAKLKRADLIYETKYKNFIYYELNLSMLDEAILWLNSLKNGDYSDLQTEGNGNEA